MRLVEGSQLADPIVVPAPPEHRSRWTRVHASALAGSVLLIWAAVAVVGGSPGRPVRATQTTVLDEPLEVTARIDVGAPVALASGNEGIWVVVYDGLVLVDPTDNSIVRRIDGPETLAYTSVAEAEGSLWVQQGNVSTSAPPAIVRIDPESGARTEFNSDEFGPHGVAVGFGSVWAIGVEGPVVRIDPESGAVLARIDVGYPAWGVDTGAGAVWVAGMAGVSRIDPVSNSVVATIDLLNASDVSVGEGAVWVTAMVPDPEQHLNVGVVVSIDPATDQVVHQTTLPQAQAVTTGNGTVWVISNPYGKGLLTAIDPSTGAIDRSLEIGSYLLGGLELVDGTIWVIEGDLRGGLLRIE